MVQMVDYKLQTYYDRLKETMDKMVTNFSWLKSGDQGLIDMINESVETLHIQYFDKCR